MKTTIELPDDLILAAQATAAREGQTLPDFIAQGLRALLAGKLGSTPARNGDSAKTENPAAVALPDITAWDRLRAAYRDPFPGLTTLQMLDEFRGTVELPPSQT